MRKLLLINLCLLLLLLVLIILLPVPVLNLGKSKVTPKTQPAVYKVFVTPPPEDVIKVDAKKHGLKTITYQLPNSFMVDDIPVIICRKTLVYPPKLPALYEMY